MWRVIVINMSPIDKPVCGFRLRLRVRVRVKESVRVKVGMRMRVEMRMRVIDDEYLKIPGSMDLFINLSAGIASAQYPKVTK